MSVIDFTLLLVIAIQFIWLIALSCTRTQVEDVWRMASEIRDEDRYIYFRTGKYEKKKPGDPDYPNPDYVEYYDPRYGNEAKSPYHREIVKKIPINPDLIQKIIEACGIELNYEPEKVETTPEVCELTVKEKKRAK